MYSKQVKQEIQRIEAAAKKHSPNDAAMRLAFQCGALTALAQVYAIKADSYKAIYVPPTADDLAFWELHAEISADRRAGNEQ